MNWQFLLKNEMSNWAESTMNPKRAKKKGIRYCGISPNLKSVFRVSIILMRIYTPSPIVPVPMTIFNTLATFWMSGISLITNKFSESS